MEICTSMEFAINRSKMVHFLSNFSVLQSYCHQIAHFAWTLSTVGGKTLRSRMKKKKFCRTYSEGTGNCEKSIIRIISIDIVLLLEISIRIITWMLD
jgi:hypothetical protein